VSSEFGHVTYTEAVEILRRNNETFEYPVEWGSDLQTEHERFLTEQVFRKPLFVTDYPKEIKAFYMRLNDDRKTVAAMDLLVPGVGEIIGGSQREERLQVLEQRMKELKLNQEDYGWYLDLRKYGGTDRKSTRLIRRMLFIPTDLREAAGSLPAAFSSAQKSVRAARRPFFIYAQNLCEKLSE
jgi:aspartyl/asparaginyl-tRNA synthetase